MALPDWHSRFSAALNDGTLRTSAWALVESELPKAQGAYRGLIMGSRALLRRKDGPVFALAALADIEAALPLLDEEPLEKFRLLLIAQGVCNEGCLIDRAYRYHHQMQRLLAAAPTNLFSDWQGRILVSVGQYQILIGDYGEANHTLAEAVGWHEFFTGPYGEHDRQCYLAMSLLALGSVRLKLGCLDDAQDLLDRAIGEMPPDSRQQGSLFELEGLIALEKGEIDRAQAAGVSMLQLGGNFAYWGAEILAKAALIADDSNLCKRYVDEGIRMAVAAGDWARVQTLESIGFRLLHKC